MYVLNALSHCMYHVGGSILYSIPSSSADNLIIVPGTSPVEMGELTAGEHSLKIGPRGCGKNRRTQNVKFTV